jgi:hypothetical protein
VAAVPSALILTPIIIIIMGYEEVGGIKIDRGNQSILRKPCSSITLSTINPI